MRAPKTILVEDPIVDFEMIQKKWIVIINITVTEESEVEVEARAEVGAVVVKVAGVIPGNAVATEALKGWTRITDRTKAANREEKADAIVTDHHLALVRGPAHRYTLIMIVLIREGRNPEL